MVKVKEKNHGECELKCKIDTKSCWHKECKILKLFAVGTFLIENTGGYVRAAVPADLEFNNEETRKYQKYDLTADRLTLEAQAERDLLRWRLDNGITTNNHKAR